MKEALGQLWHPVALIINYRSYFLNWKWNQHKKIYKILNCSGLLLLLFYFDLFYLLQCWTKHTLRRPVPSTAQSTMKVSYQGATQVIQSQIVKVRFTVHHPWKRTETQIQWSWMKLEGRNYDGWIKRKNSLASVQAVYLFLFSLSPPPTPLIHHTSFSVDLFQLRCTVSCRTEAQSNNTAKLVWHALKKKKKFPLPQSKSHNHNHCE